MTGNLQSITWMALVEEFTTDPAAPELVLKLKQDLTFTNLPTFLTFVRSRLCGGKITVWIDFSSVKFVDSAGVGGLAQLHKLAQSQGGEVVLLNANQTVKSILKIVGLVRMIRFEDLGLPATASRPGLPRPAGEVDASALAPGAAADQRPAPTPIHSTPTHEGEVDPDVDDAVSRLLLREITANSGGSSAKQVVGQQVVTIRLKGNVTGRNAGMLSDGFLSYLRKDVKTLRADLSLVDFVDSAGIAALVKVAAAFKREGGELILLSPSPNLAKVLKVARLDRFFTILTEP